ncbi:MAG TPA: CerR family C-terminal domain-containing protein [Gammaproteobacteria bacterium]|nr:CerR family C-terminal domain-containing protein [Gammaproteobacteria bacterium]
MTEPGPNVRQRLIEAAMGVFAEKGYSRASTREICRLAGANAAAIHYYFGDKATLYREVFRPPEYVTEVPEALSAPDSTLREGLEAFFRPLTRLLTESCMAPHQHMLLVREQVQPTGLLNERRVDFFRPRHEQVCRFLCRHCGAAEPDEAIEQLAISLAGMALVFFMKRDYVEAFAPGLLSDGPALAATLERLTDYGVTLAEAEARRRRAGG